MKSPEKKSKPRVVAVCYLQYADFNPKLLDTEGNQKVLPTLRKKQSQ
jgi:hypothetical protein